MAEAIVSFVLEQLLKFAVGQIQQEVKLVKGVDDEINKLISNFQIIQAVLVDAEQRQFTEAAVSLWLELLKDVSYDMDDVLDEWNTAIMRAENARTPKRKVCSCFHFPYSGLKQVVLHHGIAFKIKAINERLDAIAKQKDMYNFILTTSVQQPQRMQSTSFVDVSEIFGLDEQTKAIVSLLLCESSERKNSLHIISIVGMGGIGKTTLAQLAYNNNEVKSNFDKRIWVCVSDPFNELRIAKAINQALGGDNSNLDELDSVFKQIHESILGKKILLVLDDVWTEDSKKWEPFHNCLRNCLHGSKVLVTTRNQRTADNMRSETISIKELSNDHCWSLFSRLAFFDRSNEEREKLEGIGREIVSKCKGLPLAAKTMGSLLRFKTTVKDWESILDSKMWKLEEIEKHVFTPMLLSYYDLSSTVKQCFTYCAMFPKDFEFEKDELIKLWMTQGYLRSDHNKELERIGEDYFNILAMRSFFQEFKKDDDGSILRCKMHDIVHDVAQFLSKNECPTIEVLDFGDQSRNALCEKARHLRLMVKGSDTFLNSICNFKKLRSLLIEFDDVGSKLIYIIKLIELTGLKALGISNSYIEHIPEEIGKLIHLRYLDLSNNYELIKLPETLCELYNLQTLKLFWCKNLKELPQGIGKLINLRHLMNWNTNSLRYMPKGMERLIHLRTLDEFRLNGGDYGGKACSLEFLGHIESLWIKGLKNLVKVTNEIVQLKNNKNIRDLGLDFRNSGSDSMNNDDEAILEAFQPPPNLQELTIRCYQGPTMSTLRRMTSLTNLRSIKLLQCNVCEHLPPLGKLPSLETLVIWNMSSVREVGNEFLGVESGEVSSSSSSIIYFPKLKTLQFELMSFWEVWDFGNEDDTCTIMPSLRSLKIQSSKKLKGLPKQLLHQMAPLQHLEIERCPILEEVYEKGKGDKWQDISHIPNIHITGDYTTRDQ